MTDKSSWEKGEHHGLISIGTHRLFASISGPDRKTPTSPIAIIIPGVTCSIKEWAAVCRKLQNTTRTLVYERAGLGPSDESPRTQLPTGENIARDLDLLLHALRLKPPYLLVCHSYGGIIAREFLHRKQISGKLDQVAGMVFVDANQERNVELWPDSNLDALGKGLDLMEVTGLNRSLFLSDAERAEMISENGSEKHRRTAEAEMKYYKASCAALATKKQLESKSPLLGSRPVSVLKGNAVWDLEKIYAAGVAAGNGTLEERLGCQGKFQAYREYDEFFQRGNLRLSARNRFAAVEREAGHSVHLTNPDAIIREVQWVLDNIL